MSRDLRTSTLARFGAVIVGLSVVVFVVGIFPDFFSLDFTGGFGILQIAFLLIGLSFMTLGAYEHAAAPETGWDPRQPLRFRAETDRIFQRVPERLELRAPLLSRTVVLQTTGAASAIVWNPWPAKTARLSQMAADDWQRFACIESANVRAQAVTIAPGESHALSLRLDCRDGDD